MDIDSLVNEKIEADAEFQANLTDLSEEEKNQLIAEKKAELVKAEFNALDEKATKAEEIAHNQKVRAEKAEAGLKAKSEKETPKNDQTIQENLSLKDIRALQDVHDDDIEEVTAFAKFKGITVAEAKKNPVMTLLLKTRAEERASAQVTSTAPLRRGSGGAEETVILDNFSKGIVSEKSEDIEKLVAAQLAQRNVKVKKH